MRGLLLGALIAVIFSISYSAISFAACGGGPTIFTCGTTQPNPDPTGVQQGGNDNPLQVNVLTGAGIDTANPNCIDTGNGGNTINVNGGNLTCPSNGIRTLSGNDNINVTDSNITTTSSRCVNTSTGDDTISIVRSILTCPSADGLDVGSGNNTLDIIDSTIFADDPIDVESQPDQLSTINILRSQLLCDDQTCDGIRTGGFGTINITIEESTIRGGGEAIESLSNSIITLGTGSNIEGLINCSGQDDTLIFAMSVPTNQVEEITAEIESKDPAGDSIVINGLSYEWVDCEELVAQVEPGFEFPVPTLSEWGLIAMAGLLGIIGFIVVRKRQFITNI